jgi:hypothetical protein
MNQKKDPAVDAALRKIVNFIVDECINEGPRPPEAYQCRWTEDDDGYWHSACGQIHGFTEGGPKENRHRFCSYCGLNIKESTNDESGL